MNVPNLAGSYDRERIVFGISAIVVTALVYFAMIFIGTIHSVWGIYAGLALIFEVLLWIFYEMPEKEIE